MSDKRVEILERALRWYADPKNWSEDSFGVRAVVDPPDYGDAGSKARNALARAARVRPDLKEKAVAITTRTIISAVWDLRRRGSWPTAAAIAKHLDTSENVVRPLLGELKADRIFKDRRRGGEQVWGPWDGAEFERR